MAGERLADGGLPMRVWVATRHSRAVPSRLPVARILPSGGKATEAMPSGASRGSPMLNVGRTSHSRAVSSSLPVARILPSGAEGNGKAPVAVAKGKVVQQGGGDGWLRRGGLPGWERF
ncbi:hypothetical protein GCM10027203_68380 [Nonomuraea fastidiosa]